MYAGQLDRLLTGRWDLSIRSPDVASFLRSFDRQFSAVLAQGKRAGYVAIGPVGSLAWVNGAAVAAVILRQA
jgi:hypothetical protein